MSIRSVVAALCSAALVLLISGCASDRYLFLEKADLNSVSETIDAQTREIGALQSSTTAAISQLSENQQVGYERLLAAIEEQVQAPACPPLPEIPVCAIQPPKYQEPSPARSDRLQGKLVVGELERFYLVNPGLEFVARIDSGAATSSLDARNITRFERDGQNWVRFDVPVPNTDQLVTLEREISRRVRIIQSSSEEAERRVVVELQFMIGDHRQQAEFTLTDRQHLSHSVLVGRNILRDVMLVDVGREFATELPSGLPLYSVDGTP